MDGPDLLKVDKSFFKNVMVSIHEQKLNRKWITQQDNTQ